MIDARVLPNAYLNGEIVPIEQARIPALDRGFLFGDAIYEVVPVYAGKLFRPQSHIQRLTRGLKDIHINNRWDDQYWHNVFERIVQANGGGDQYIYMQVTRGVSHYRDHATPSDLEPLVFGMSQVLAPRAAHVNEHGIEAVLIPDTRWARCDIKSTSLLANVLLRQAAIDQDANEAILHRDGFVTEGAASTIMLVSDNVLIAPPNNTEVLPGTTRRLVIELADHISMAHETRKFTVDELVQADEVLLSAATKELLPVCRIDGRPVGNGKPGAGWKALDQAYQSYKSELIDD